MRAALLQIRVDDEEPVSDRVSRVLAIIGKVAAGEDPGIPVVANDDLAAQGSPDLIVLPELWTVGAFNMEEARDHPVDLDGDLLNALGGLARTHGCVIHAGTFPEVTGADRYNTAVVVGADGATRARYRKIHLFGFDSGEALELTAGTQECLTSTPLGATGLATCYDLRFPELFRRLTVQGASAFVIASGWPITRIDHWNVLLQARAIENQAWVLGCNQVGTHAGVVLGGHSAIIDPNGRSVIEGPADTECVVMAEIDPELSGQARQQFPVLRDRRL